tara:strand:+ start:407 stop:763 length:357 start_codon:yes stop_codon:yes gene_type:complete
MKITSNHKIALLDICMSDYFSGYHLPCLAVSIYRTVTFKEIAEEMESEYNSIYESINPNEDKEIDNLYDNYFAELKAKGSEIFFECEDISQIEDSEPLYAYFSIINPTYKYGLNFLNP